MILMIYRVRLYRLAGVKLALCQKGARLVERKNDEGILILIYAMVPSHNSFFTILKPRQLIGQSIRNMTNGRKDWKTDTQTD